MFVDEAFLDVVAGHGGRGAVSFRREKFVPRGGPDGGNGGAGGSIWVVARQNQNTLARYRFHPRVVAESGRNGAGARSTGRSGADRELAVPPGTLVIDRASEAVLGDLDRPGERLLVARGGRGGRGNATFARSTDQSPRRFDEGEPGEQRQLRLELRLLADVGLVGLPNAGKSTLIRRVSSARPKVADYPFTTLAPHLGVVDIRDAEGFVLADIPGLIAGAHAGAGLGLEFLRHVLRTQLLVFLIDVSEASGRSPAEDLETLMGEMVAYGRGLESRPAVVVANKRDILSQPDRLQSLAQTARSKGLDLFCLSAATGEGVAEFVGALATRIRCPEPAEES